jgi:hypothetical protein
LADLSSSRRVAQPFEDPDALARLNDACEFGFSVHPTGCKILEDAKLQLMAALDELYRTGRSALENSMRALLGEGFNEQRLLQVAADPVLFYMESRSDCERVLSINCEMWVTWKHDLSLWRRVCDATFIKKDMPPMNWYLLGSVSCETQWHDFICIDSTETHTSLQYRPTNQERKCIRYTAWFSNVVGFPVGAALMDELIPSFRGAAMIANALVDLHTFPRLEDLAIDDGLDLSTWNVFVQVFDDCVCGYGRCQRSLEIASNLMFDAVSVHCTIDDGTCLCFVLYVALCMWNRWFG